MKNKIIFLCLFSCQSIDPNLTTDELYEKTQTLLENKKYKNAEEYLEALKTKSSFKFSSMDLLWMEGDIYFGQKEYSDAIYSYQLFLDLYPKHPKVNAIKWKIVLAYRKLIGTSFDRDITYCPTLVRVAAPFAESQEEARDFIQHCHKLMAEKELAIADLYYRTGKKTGALERLNYFFDLFQGVHLPDKILELAKKRKKEWTKK